MDEKLKDDVYVHLGRRMRKLWTANRLTQSAVAKVIDVSPQQYQKYEDAQSKCSLNYILTLADYYSVPIDDLLPIDIQHNPQAPVTPPPAPTEIRDGPQMEADLLARLVSSYVKLGTVDAKLRLVQFVEAMVANSEAKR